MKFKSHLLLSSALLGLVNVSCQKDDDSTEYSDTDSRIRSVYIHGVNVPLIVNDYEHIIYNYDSLTYGTDISHMMIYFADYDVKSPGLTYYVNEGGDWKSYSNKTADSVYLDLRNLQVRTLSLDKNNISSYKLDIRVHQFDVNSFNWQKLSDLKFNGKVKTFNTVDIAGKYCYFYTNDSGVSYMLSSTTGKSWKSKKLDKQDYDWSSLAVFGEKAVAFAGDKIAVIDVANDCKVSLNDNSAGLKSLLFTLGDNYWAVGPDGIYTCADDDLDFKKEKALPVDFPSENIETLVTLTGARTRIGYIYGTSNGEPSVWAIDKGGNVIKTATAANGLPVLAKTSLLNVDDELCLIGGINAKKEYLNTCYSSSDAGINWAENWHKEIPSEIGRVANLGTFVTEEGQVIYISGVTENGVSTSVWTGTLKGTK